MSEQNLSAEEILRQLSGPFDAAEVKCKPAGVSGNRAMALFYVDARVVQDRLDDVLGVDNWQDEYAVQGDGGVVCKLSCRIAGEWIAKMDVGGPSEQPDGGDRLKAAFSDALKRAAVKFGIGRYLYRVPTQWVDYDPKKRAFARPPQIPAGVLTKATHQAPANGNNGANGHGPHPAPPPKRTFAALEKQAVAAGLCAPGELLAHVNAVASKHPKYPGPDLAKWPKAAKEVGWDIAEQFLAARRARAAAGGRGSQQSLPPAAAQLPTGTAPLPTGINEEAAQLQRQEERRRLIWGIHADLGPNRTWLGLLREVGKELPADWPEPQSPEEAVVALNALADLTLLRKMAAKLAPTGKKAPGRAAS